MSTKSQLVNLLSFNTHYKVPLFHQRYKPLNASRNCPKHKITYMFSGPTTTLKTRKNKYSQTLGHVSVIPFTVK